jgi:hypothetical protein
VSRLLATITVTATLLGAAGCTGSPRPTAASGTPSPTPAPAPPSAGLAGASEARALAPLPSGAATGSAVLSYAGVGEVRAPFNGRCSHDVGTTRLDGFADTAHITVDVTPTGARVQLRDVGLSATSDLTTGRYAVSGDHLSLAAHLAHDGEQIGSMQLDATCGG